MAAATCAAWCAHAGPPDPDEYLARSISRVATLDVRAVSSPTMDDFQVASDLLESAMSFAPHDREIARQWLEAAWSAGDRATALDVTRRLITIDPRDEIAALRLIAARIGELQTAEERQAAYARLLGQEGEAISPSIRSRLALDAALLAREQGDMDGFVRWLGVSTRLDGTNKEAAALAATYFSSVSNNAMGNLEMLVNLLYADPLDPNVHLSMALAMASQHAFGAAQRFHTNAENLFIGALGYVGQELYLGRLYLLWQSQGAEAVLQAMEQRLEEVRAEEVATIRRQGRIATPEEVEMVTLSVPFELIRVMSAHAARDEESLNQAMEAFALVVRSEMERVAAESTDEAFVEAEQRRLLLDLVMARLVCERNVPEAIEHLGLLVSAWPKDRPMTPAMTMAAGLAAMREGNFEQARELLGPIAQRTEWGAMAYGLLELEAGRTAEAVNLFQQVSIAAPLTLPGCWSRSSLAWIDPSLLARGPYADDMERLVSYIPASVDAMAVNPWEFMSLTVEATRDEVDALERAPLRIVLRNISDMPLGAGANRPLSTRLLFSPRAELGPEPLIGGAPEVVEIDTRFRLNPRESLEMNVSPELWWFGAVLETAAKHPTALRWRVLQGFRISPRGIYVQGPSSVTAQAPKIRRRTLPEAALSADELADRLRETPEQDLIAIVAAARAIVTGPRPKGEPRATNPEVETIAAAAAARYPMLAPKARMLMVAVMPHARMAPMMRVLDEAMLAERDPSIARLVIVTRPVDTRHEIFSWATASDDPALSRVAKIQMRRLASGQQCYARIRDLVGQQEGPLPGAAP